MSRAARSKPGPGFEPRPLPAGPSRPDGLAPATRPAEAEASPGMSGSSSMPPADPETLASRNRLISYIAGQIASDLLREGRLSPGKGT
jgi:hypothetical protein